MIRRKKTKKNIIKKNNSFISITALCVLVYNLKCDNARKTFIFHKISKRINRPHWKCVGKAQIIMHRIQPSCLSMAQMSRSESDEKWWKLKQKTTTHWWKSNANSTAKNMDVFHLCSPLFLLNVRECVI